MRRQLKYRRVLLKLSGAFLRGKPASPPLPSLDLSVVDSLIGACRHLLQEKVQIAVVVGGGNFLRGHTLSSAGVSRVVADQMGLLATIMNGLALRDRCTKLGVDTYLASAIPTSFCDVYDLVRVQAALEGNQLVLLAGGLGTPLFTTDTAACARAIELSMELLLKGTQVEAVFNADPTADRNAVAFRRLSYEKSLSEGYKIMDLTAFAMAKEHSLPIRVFNIAQKNALMELLYGADHGTLITSERHSDQEKVI